MGKRVTFHLRVQNKKGQEISQSQETSRIQNYKEAILNRSIQTANPVFFHFPWLLFFGNLGLWKKLGVYTVLNLKFSWYWEVDEIDGRSHEQPPARPHCAGQQDSHATCSFTPRKIKRGSSPEESPIFYFTSHFQHFQSPNFPTSLAQFFTNFLTAFTSFSLHKFSSSFSPHFHQLITVFPHLQNSSSLCASYTLFLHFVTVSKKMQNRTCCRPTK